VIFGEFLGDHRYLIGEVGRHGDGPVVSLIRYDSRRRATAGEFINYLMFIDLTFFSTCFGISSLQSYVVDDECHYQIHKIYFP